MNTPRSLYHKYMGWLGFAILLIILLIVIWFINTRQVSDSEVDDSEKAMPADVASSGLSLATAMGDNERVGIVDDTILADKNPDDVSKSSGNNISLTADKQANPKQSSVTIGKEGLISEKKLQDLVPKDMSTASITTADDEKVVADAENYSAGVTAAKALKTFRFGLSSRKINVLSRSEIKQLIDFVNKCSDKIIIVGHTCNLGVATFNNQLGLERAATIKRQLIRQGANPEVMTIRSEGMQSPVASNTTEHGRSLNRRVEVFCDDG